MEKKLADICYLTISLYSYLSYCKIIHKSFKRYRASNVIPYLSIKVITSML